MKKKILFTIVCILLIINTLANAENIKVHSYKKIIKNSPITFPFGWSKNYGGTSYDGGFSVQQTNDDGFIITGYTESYSAGAYDVYLLKTDSNGKMLWENNFGGTEMDGGHCVKQTSDGGYIIVGYTESKGYGGLDVWLIKTDSSGNKLWDKTYGGVDEEVGLCVQQISTGEYIITGYTESKGAGSFDVWLIKTDSLGSIIWDNTFGGTGLDVGTSVQQTSGGEYIITGYTDSFGSGGLDVWLIKTDSSGNKLWDYTFGGVGYDRGYSVQQTLDGGYIIAGETFSSGSSFDIYLIKTDSTGKAEWSNTFGGIDMDGGQSVQQTGDNGYIIAGYTESYSIGGWDGWLIKIDDMGNNLWSNVFGDVHYDILKSVQQTNDGGYITTGITEISNFNRDVFLIKTDADGKSKTILSNNYLFEFFYKHPILYQLFNRLRNL